MKTQTVDASHPAAMPLEAKGMYRNRTRRFGTVVLVVVLAVDPLDAHGLGSVALADAPDAEQGYRTYDSYRIELETNVERGQANGRMSLRYKNVGRQALNEVRLRADANLGSTSSLEVSSIRQGDGSMLQWHYLPLKFGKTKSERGQRKGGSDDLA